MNKSIEKGSFVGIALLISMYFSPEPGGGARTALNRASILHRVGYKVFVLCGFPSYPTGRVTEEKYKGKFIYIERMDDFTLIRLRLLPLGSKGYIRRFILFINFNFLALLWMPKILRLSSNVQIVYALAPILFSSGIGYFYSKVTKAFFIYEVSAFWPEELVALKSNTFFVLLFFGKIFAKISYSIPDMLIVISNSAAKYLADNYHPNAQIYAMPIGVDTSKYHARPKESSRTELIKKNILPAMLKNKFIVLYSGVITKVTKVDNLVYAAKKLKNSENNIAFLIIGEGEDKERLRVYRSENMINNLYMLPFQDGSLVPSIISAADVCVVPLSSEPIYETTVPTKFFDYLACNKPLIGICEGELANLINSNNIGKTVIDGETDNLIEVILSFKNSPSLIQLMAQNSGKVLVDFTLDSLASKFGITLENVIKNNKKWS